MSCLFLDLESAPLWSAIDTHWPLGDPPEWDPASVKYGNAKRAELREQKEADALAAHNEAVAAWGSPEHLDRHRREALDANRCLLNPCLSQVCAVGTQIDCGEVVIEWEGDDYPERDLMEVFADLVHCHSGLICGWNIKGFDIPYLAFRMRVHGIEPPPLMLPERNGRYFGDGVVDLMEVCALGQHSRNYKLKHAAVALGGFPPSPEPDGGKFFWELPRDRQDAYLRWDVEAVAHIYGKLFHR